MKIIKFVGAETGRKIAIAPREIIRIVESKSGGTYIDTTYSANLYVQESFEKVFEIWSDVIDNESLWACNMKLGKDE